MLRPSDILILSRTIVPLDHLPGDLIVSLGKIKLENPRNQVSRKNTSSRNKRSGNKTSFKKKAESFDDAMRLKIIADLNKISDKNYDVIVEEIQKLYSRISQELKKDILRMIIDNSTKQHIYVKEYVKMFMDLTKDSKEEHKMGNDILLEAINNHEKLILDTLSNGETYDDFCEANKIKTSKIGMSIMIGEACNFGIIPPGIIGQHAMNLLKTMEKVCNNAKDTNKETIENQTECILRFFRTIAKTKINKDGFQTCIARFKDLLQKEKTEKKLNPKARFALMDFVDDMNKLHAEEKAKNQAQKKNIYVPKRFFPMKKTS